MPAENDTGRIAAQKVYQSLADQPSTNSKTQAESTSRRSLDVNGPKKDEIGVKSAALDPIIAAKNAAKALANLSLGSKKEGNHNNNLVSSIIAPKPRRVSPIYIHQNKSLPKSIYNVQSNDANSPPKTKASNTKTKVDEASEELESILTHVPTMEMSNGDIAKVRDDSLKKTKVKDNRPAAVIAASQISRLFAASAPPSSSPTTQQPSRNHALIAASQMRHQPVNLVEKSSTPNTNSKAQKSLPSNATSIAAKAAVNKSEHTTQSNGSLEDAPHSTLLRNMTFNKSTDSIQSNTPSEQALKAANSVKPSVPQNEHRDPSASALQAATRSRLSESSSERPHFGHRTASFASVMSDMPLSRNDHALIAAKSTARSPIPTDSIGSKESSSIIAAKLSALAKQRALEAEQREQKERTLEALDMPVTRYYLEYQQVESPIPQTPALPEQTYEYPELSRRTNASYASANTSNDYSSSFDIPRISIEDHDRPWQSLYPITKSAPSSRPPSPLKKNKKKKHKPKEGKTPQPLTSIVLRKPSREKTDSRSHSPNRHIRKSKSFHELPTDAEKKRYEGVWAANREKVESEEDGDEYIITAYAVKELWERSRLSWFLLERIWNLVDRKGDGNLRREEFLVGMWLIDQSLRGRKLPPYAVLNEVWSKMRNLALDINLWRKNHH